MLPPHARRASQRKGSVAIQPRQPSLLSGQQAHMAGRRRHFHRLVRRRGRAAVEPPLQHAPPRRYPPSLYRNRFDVNHLEAAWDLLHRPCGVSVRAFTRAFRHLHDEPPDDLLELMQLDDRFVFFWPTPRQQSASCDGCGPIRCRRHSQRWRPRGCDLQWRPSTRLACSASVEPVTLRSLMWPLGSFRQLPPASRRRLLRLVAVVADLGPAKIVDDDKEDVWRHAGRGTDSEHCGRQHCVQHSQDRGGVELVLGPD